MKIDIVCKNAHSVGGIERTSEMIRSYLSRKHDVKIVSLIDRQVVDEDADVVIFQEFSHYTLKFIESYKRVSNAKIIVAHHGAPEVWHYFLEGERKEPLEFSFVGAKRLIKKVLWNLGYKKRGEKKIEKLYRDIYFNSDSVVLLSRNFFDKYIQIASLEDRGAKLRAIPNSLRFSNVDIYEGERKNILFVGRLAGIKRIDRVIDVWRLIYDKYKDWSLKIVGEGSLESHLRSQACGLERIEFVPQCSDVSCYYRQSSILLLTSDLEGFGMVITEAMQFGVVPVVYESFSSLVDIVEDGVDGYRVTPFDVAQFVDKVTRLIEDPQLREQMGRCAAESVKKFEIEKIMPFWEDLVDEFKN